MTALWKRKRPHGPKLVRLSEVQEQYAQLIENLRRGSRETRAIRGLMTFSLKESLKILTNAAKNKSEW